MRAHLEIGTTPWCDWIGCVAGLETAMAADVMVCEFPTIREAENAARRLRPFFKRGRVRVVHTECPNA